MTDAEFRSMVEHGLIDAEVGRTIRHDEVKELLACRRAFGWEPLNGTPTFPARLKWTRERFYAAVEANVFGEDEKLELIRGEVFIEGMRDRFKTSPQYAWAVTTAATRLQSILGEEYIVRQFAPLSLLEDSDPEPDIAIVDRTWEDRIDSHPTSAILIVEVSEETIEFDRTYKAALYAEAGIPDYWILNLNTRRLEVRGEPIDGRYASLTEYSEDETVSPVAKPDTSLKVADLLPRRRVAT